jgi:hypothetical protein
MRVIRFSLLCVAVVAMCLIISEIGRRILDGYQVTGMTLVKDGRNTDLTWSGGQSTEALLRSIKRDLEVDPSWFYERPQPLEGVEPEWAQKRRIAVEVSANYVFNEAAIKEAGLQAFLRQHQNRLEKIFTFPSPDGRPYPSYRLYPGIETGFGVTNQYGWRSRPVTPIKPSGVIRIGVLGDSTTNRYPAMLEHWLNLWAARRNIGVRFEILNAARPASNPFDAAAIVEFEFGTIVPDYVLVYGFGNGIYVADTLIKLPPPIVKGQPASVKAGETESLSASIPRRMSEILEPLTPFSAAAVFARNRLLGQRGGPLAAEPDKPATELVFPKEINEHSPDPATLAKHRTGGLMGLESYLQGLDSIDAIAKARGIRLFVSTFRVMAFDGMLLAKGDPNNGGIIYSVINEGYWWPYTYAQIRRISAFYNRTLTAWTRSHGHEIIPVDEQMPWRPELYGDGLHELPTGEALHAWIVLQQMMPRIRADLAEGRFTRTPSAAGPYASTSYWRIDRTPVAPVIRTQTAVPQVVATDAAVEAATPGVVVPGAFQLSELVPAYGKAAVETGAVPIIHTAAESFAYAAAIPVQQLALMTLSGRGWVDVRLHVQEGAVSVGILNKAADRFLAQTTVTKTSDIREVRLALDELSDVGSLMISNYRPGESARSTVALHAVEMSKRRP